MSEASLNEVTLIGRLGKDPEMKRGENGSTRTAFSLATNEVWKDRNGEQREHVEWHRVVCWGNVAESCGTYLRQGRRVWARGRLRTRKWDDAGTDRYITEVHAMSVIFLDGSKETGQTADDGQHAARSEEQPRETREDRQQRLLREGRERAKQYKDAPAGTEEDPGPTEKDIPF